jgi:hypothetical protein
VAIQPTSFVALKDGAQPSILCCVQQLDIESRRLRAHHIPPSRHEFAGSLAVLQVKCSGQDLEVLVNVHGWIGLLSAQHCIGGIKKGTLMFPFRTSRFECIPIPLLGK